MDEADYRNLIQKVFNQIEKEFKDVDPDVAECEQALGALTITFGDQTRCILSAQPSVRQLWLALSSRGIAYHFNYDPSRGQWLDDKSKGIELLSFLSSSLKELVGIDFKF